MVQVVENVQGPQPGRPGGEVIAVGVPDIAEVGAGLGFGAAGAKLPEEPHSALIALGGTGQVAELVLGAAEAVPADGLTDAVAEFLLQGQGLLADHAGLPEVAELGVT